MATRRAATKTVATTENTTKETVPVKTTKKFEQNELIECRSLVLYSVEKVRKLRGETYE